MTTPMEAGEQPATFEEAMAELTLLRRQHAEYLVMSSALAVLAERLIARTDGNAIVLSERALAESPDLIVRRDNRQRRLVIRTAR